MLFWVKDSLQTSHLYGRLGSLYLSVWPEPGLRSKSSRFCPSSFALSEEEKLVLTEEKVPGYHNLPQSMASSSLLAFLMLFNQWDPCISIISLCRPSALMEWSCMACCSRVSLSLNPS